MKPLLFGAIAGALLCAPALAQQQTQQNQQQNGNNGAVLQLPPNVQNVVSIDAFNMIIIASDGEQPGETRYTPTRIKHVYSGGIARLFGGYSVPTAQFVTPGAFDNNQNGNQNNNQNGGVAAVGGNTGNAGFGGGFQNNGAQNGFGGGFGNGGNFGGFGNGNLSGQGFDTLRRNDIISARLRAR